MIGDPHRLYPRENTACRCTDTVDHVRVADRCPRCWRSRKEGPGVAGGFVELRKSCSAVGVCGLMRWR